MELAYSCEKSESEAARLILRLWRPFLRVTGFLLSASGVVFLLALVAEWQHGAALGGAEIFV